MPQFFCSAPAVYRIYTILVGIYWNSYLFVHDAAMAHNQRNVTFIDATNLLCLKSTVIIKISNELPDPSWFNCMFKKMLQLYVPVEILWLVYRVITKLPGPIIGLVNVVNTKLQIAEKTSWRLDFHK